MLIDPAWFCELAVGGCVIALVGFCFGACPVFVQEVGDLHAD